MPKFVTREIPAYALRVGDVITEHPIGKREVRTVVRSITRWNKHATASERKIYHTSCRGIHVNDHACWDADERVMVTRDVSKGTDIAWERAFDEAMAA
jgi:hypothetical protein